MSITLTRAQYNDFIQCHASLVARAMRCCPRLGLARSGQDSLYHLEGSEHVSDVITLDSCLLSEGYSWRDWEEAGGHWESKCPGGSDNTERDHPRGCEEESTGLGNPSLGDR